MGALLVGIARFAIQLGLISGITWILDKTVFAVLDHMTAKIVTATGMMQGYTKAEAEAATAEVMQNAWHDAARDLAVGAALLHTKLPQAATERIGLTSKGWKTPVRVGKSGEIVTKIRGTGPVIIGAAQPAIEDVATIAVKAGRGSFAAINAALSFIAKIVGIPVGILFTAAQFIDFAAWNSSAYQGTFQKILGRMASLLGQKFEPDKPYPRPTAVSSEVFDKLYLVYQEQNVVGINDPYKNVSVTFTRQNLIDLVDKTGAHILSLKGAASFKDVLAATQLYMYSTASGFGRKIPGTAPAAPSAPSQPSAPSAPASGGSAPSAATFKVFSGVVSQGTLGAPLTFVSRENDLIESTDELKQSAEQNLAPYVAALPGKIAYEIKIVPSVVTRDGFRQYGTSQRIQTSSTSAGIAKYKTVTNRFAVLTLYFVGPTGKRMKLDTITLGPTDAVKLQPSQAALSQLETGLQDAIFTSNVNDIATIQSAGQTTTIPTGNLGGQPQQPTPSPIAAPQPVVVVVPQRGYIKFVDNPNGPAYAIGWTDAGKLKQTNLGMLTVELVRRGDTFRGLKGLSLNPSPSGSGASGLVVLDQGRSTITEGGLWGIAQAWLEETQRIDFAKLSEKTSYTGDLALAEALRLKALGKSDIPGVPDTVVQRVELYSLANYLSSSHPQQLIGQVSAAEFLGQQQAPPVTQTSQSPACGKITLSEFYTAQGKPLPSVSDRSKIYASMGLGVAAYYTGTAEQNNKLLEALKRDIGCTL